MAVRIESRAEPIPGYRLIERLGGGGFGEVWKAEAPGGLHKAIKFVFGDLKAMGGDGHRAEQELKALSRVKTVRHPYILTLERYDIIDGQLMIVMELADRNLWDRFKECRTQGLPGIPRDELLGYMDETAEALDLMNSEYQLQHLDIKPQNLFLIFNHVKVADFGLVKDLEGDQASVTGGVTPVYAAPETFDGYVSRFSDQYSLAIVYQELLTGQRPFSGNNIRQLIMQHLSAQPNVAPLPAADQPIIARALSKTPDSRFPTCREMVVLLKRNSLLGNNGHGFGTPAPPVAPQIPYEETESGPSTDSTRTASHRTRHGQDSAPGTTQFLRAMEAAALVAGSKQKSPSSVESDGTLFPGLVIGLGQMGMAVLQRLREELVQRVGNPDMLAQLRLLLLDTDPDVMRAAARGGPAALSAAEVMLTPLNRPSYYLKPRAGKPSLESWLNPRLLYRIPRSQVTTGVRALGRLAFLDNYRGIVQRLEATLGEMLKPEELQTAAEKTGLGIRTNRPRVYLVTSLGGGTGSGMFLDLAYNVRRLLLEMGYERPDVVGVLLVPPADAGRVGSLPLGNSYAALTELGHFATPTTRFVARYLEHGQAMEDSEPPFSRCIILPLPEESDETATRELVHRTGQFLSRDLVTPLGRNIDLARAGADGPPWQSRGLFYQTFGMFTLSWPQQMMLRNAARTLCHRLVQRWKSKNSKPVRELVEQWVREQWTAKELGAEQFIARLRAECQKSLGREPETALASITAPLAERLAAHAAQAAQNRKPLATPEIDPEETGELLRQIEELVGNPKDESQQQEKPALLCAVIHQTSDNLTNEWSQRLAEISVQLIEEPAYRLAGAEEAVRQAVATLEQALRGQENLGRDLAGRSAEAYERLRNLIDTPKPGKRPPAADVLELLRCYAKWRYQGLILQQTTASFVSLRGHLSDELREINFCRVRLTELQRQLEETPSAKLEIPASQGKQLYPGRCKTLQEAVAQFVEGLGPDCLVDLDTRLQEVIKNKFTALVHVCVTNANILKNVETALIDETTAFAAERLPPTNVAEMFLEQFPDEQAALEQINGYFDDAYPQMKNTKSSRVSSLCVLAVPPGPAGDAFRELALKAVPDLEIHPAPSDGDIVFYRELSSLPLAELEQLGPLGQETYRQMAAAEHFTPHTRNDIDFLQR